MMQHTLKAGGSVSLAKMIPTRIENIQWCSTGTFLVLLNQWLFGSDTLATVTCFFNFIATDCVSPDADEHFEHHEIQERWLLGLLSMQDHRLIQALKQSEKWWRARGRGDGENLSERRIVLITSASPFGRTSRILL